MYKNKTKQNSSGFAHHALLGVLVVAVISFVGVRLLTLSHAQDLQSANTAGMATSCGHIQLVSFEGIQKTQADPNMNGAMEARLHLEQKHFISDYNADLIISNSAAKWRHDFHRSGYASQVTPKGVSIFIPFHAPVWAATVNPTFTFTLHVNGWHTPHPHKIKCHSLYAGRATAVCDAKTGLWRLVLIKP